MNPFKTIKLSLPVGTICMEKRYNIFKRIWHKIRKKPLPFNKFCINGIPNLDVSFFEYDKNNLKFLAPKKPYSTKEMCKLYTLLGVDCVYLTDLDQRDIIAAVNAIRNNTIQYDNLNTLAYHCFYKQL